MPELEIPRYDDMDTKVHWSPAFAAALVAHALLVLALTLGLNWRRTTDAPVVFEAELWAAVPQEQVPSKPAPAPQAVPEPEPVPPPEPAPPPPEPEPPAPLPEVKPPEPTPLATGDIALRKAQEEQARAEAERQAQLLREQAEQARLAEEKAERERIAKAKAQAEKERQAKLAKEKAEQERQAKLAREQAERERVAKAKAEKERQAKLAREKAERERVAKEKAEQAELARIDAVTRQMRDEQIQRAAGLAGGSAAQGSATVARGPSASYGAKVVAAVKPNLIFTGHLDTNPAATVEVKTAPNGEIIGRRLVRSSGVQAWDQAVLRAVDRTGFLPLDENGSIPSPLQIKFRPND